MSSLENPPAPTAAPGTGTTTVVTPPADVAWAPAAAPRRHRRPLPGILRMTVLAAGVLMLVGGTFLAYELWASSLIESRSQARLLAEFKRSLVLDDSSGLVTPPEGHPVGVLEIPSIHVEQVVVQGIGSADTKLGPGHDPSTPAPGQAGNAVLVGRSTTYGGPFRHLDRLRPGAQIYVVTRQGRSSYTVTEQRRFALGDTAPAAATTESRLTLITADPLLARREVVVVALADGEPVQAPGPLPLRPAGERPGRSTSVNGRWGPMLLWGQLLALTAAVAAYLYRRGWSPSVTYLLTTPVLITLAVLFYGSIDNLLPPSL
jgi:sortase A